VMTGFFLIGDELDVGAEFVVGVAGDHVSVEVVVELREEASADLAVGGQANTGTGSTERVGDGRDNADLTDAIGKREAARGVAGVVERERAERCSGAFVGGENLAHGDDDFGCPDAVLFERHELDEAHDDAFFARKLAELDDLILVEATQQNAIHFHRIKARTLGGTNPGQHLLEAVRHARDAREAAEGRLVRIEAAAKEATQTAEDARMMAVKQKAEAEAQSAAAAREARARADADAEGRRRVEAETARQEAEQARAQAEQAKAEAERMKQEALAAAQDAARQKEEAEKAKAEAVAQQQALAVEADKAKAAAAESDSLRQQAEILRQQAEKDKADLRARLLSQLNSILATRDSARGLIANMSDVLFRSGRYELLPAARERLAKVSGIILAYPSLHLAVEGHTDSVGGDEYNQNLSEQRAQAVRDYFVQQGLTANSIEARGFGKTEPIASNDTTEGRAQNRRVELVLSGDAIGNAIDGAGPAQTASSQK